MSLPSPSLSVPTLSDGQISFQGVTMGGTGTPFGLVTLDGLDKPDVRSGNTDRPRTRGANVGLNLLKPRTITATMDVGPPFGSYTNFAGATSALRTALSTEGTTEYPLWIKLPGFSQVACMARVTKANAKYDYTAAVAGLMRNIPIQFEAADPYLYTSPTIKAQVSLPIPGVGFAFPLTFNWSFGGASTAGQALVYNGGDVPCWPVLIITGPCVNPIVSNTGIAGNPTLTFGIQLYAGDVLTVDCDQQSIMFTPNGQTVGAPAPQILQPGSSYFAITGTDAITFNSQDTAPAAGTLGVWFAAAVYDGLIL